MAYVQFYCGDPNAPKPTQRTRLGANVLIVYNGKLLLEKRVDSDLWGLIGGGTKAHESTLDSIVREVKEELGLQIPKGKFVKKKIYDEPRRIAAYRDGSVWRMVIVAYAMELDFLPELKISKESKELRFFDRDELKNINIVVTHSDIVDELFLHK
ncbi:MAG: NUDIX domain-containing protein [Oscillospiraceae bacterium]|nr:NUDIX domain-containing protein [Oscillospiraceae bacterium]